MSFDVVGVVGAGVIGCGVGQGLAQTRHEVVIVDRSDSVLTRARSTIRNELRLKYMLKPDAARDPLDIVTGRIRFTTNYSDLAHADAVIENVTEDWELKRDAHSGIDDVCSPDCLIAANTSAISITRIASVNHNPARVIGMHFMNPVALKDTVEIICGYHTSADTVTLAEALLAGMSKRGILVKDMPGFVSNRVLMLTVNEAIFLVQDGVADVEQIDDIFRSCFGHPMGPLQTADLIGLDTVLNSIEALHQSYADSKYRPCPLLKKMVDAGLHGRKSGQGFYAYDNQPVGVPLSDNNTGMDGR